MIEIIINNNKNSLRLLYYLKNEKNYKPCKTNII